VQDVAILKKVAVNDVLMKESQLHREIREIREINSFSMQENDSLTPSPLAGEGGGEGCKI
jgi:hypothetical protein